MTEDQQTPQQGPHGHRLGEMLRAARESGGLGLAEVSRNTAVRRDYLEALEESRYGDLPEPVYVRNFVRLFAQAVGLDPRAALQMYAAEINRQESESETPEPERAARTGAAAAPAQRRERSRSGGSRETGRRPALGTWLPTLILVVLVVGLAVWGFNSTLFRPGTVTVEQPPTAPGTSQGADGTEAAPAGTEPAAASTVRLSVSTEPPGARVLVDSFPLEGLTPISLAPVTARDPRLIRVELDGYEPQEASLDLTFDRNISFVLQEAAEPVEAEADPDEGIPEAAAADGTITVTVTDESWLEIYPGTAREGTPHVYTTAQSGQEWTFDLPVYVRAGNAAGVSVSVSGQNLGPLGSAGEITGRAFTAED